MQTFQSRFTTDISQHQRTMGMFREQTCAAVRQARTELLSLGAVSIGGVGLKGMITNTVKLGAEMQNTRLAFETMMGSARKGNALIAMLEQFADVTPYDNDEVIKSGRMLLNVGVTTEELAKKLTMIGDIAAGTQQPLQDMVAIYAKAANKGKVQAEELAQLSERGVPVIQTLAKMLGVSTEEIMKFGAEGKLSFALLEEAFAKMTAQGGQYAGLMEKQSESLAGKWAGVEVELNKFATSIGEKAIPGLTQAVDDFLAKIAELKESGELDKMATQTAALITQAAQALKSFVNMISENKEMLSSFGMKIGALYMIVKGLGLIRATGRWIIELVKAAAQTVDAATIRSMEQTAFAEQKKRAEILATEKLRETLAARRAMFEARGALAQAQRGGGSPEQLKVFSQTAEAATARYRELRTASLEAWRAIPAEPPAGVAAFKRSLADAGKQVAAFGKNIGGVFRHPVAAATMAVQNFAAAASVAFAGYELGKYLAKLLDVEGVLTRMILKTHGLSDAQIEDGLSGDNVQALVPKLEFAKSADRLKAIRAEMEKLRAQSATLKTAGKTADAEVLDNRVTELDCEAAELEEAAKRYAATGESAAQEIVGVRERLKEAARKANEIKARKPVEQFSTSPDRPNRTYQLAYEAWKKEVEAADRTVGELRKRYQTLNATVEQYRASLTEYHAWQKREAVKAASESADKAGAAAEFRRKEAEEKRRKELEQQKQFAQKEAEIQARINQTRAEAEEGRRKIGVEKQRDEMSGKIAGWRKEIEGYQRDIEKTEKMLGKLGFSVNEDILKTPEQIAQERKDARLRKKIEFANRGATVSFTAEERDRINSMQTAQQEARRKQKQIAGKESAVARTERKIATLDRDESTRDRANREKMMQQKLAVSESMAQQLETLKRANQPLETKLKSIESVLKQRLPDETVGAL